MNLCTISGLSANEDNPGFVNSKSSLSRTKCPSGTEQKYCDFTLHILI